MRGIKLDFHSARKSQDYEVVTQKADKSYIFVRNPPPVDGLVDVETTRLTRLTSFSGLGLIHLDILDDESISWPAWSVGTDDDSKSLDEMASEISHKDKIHRRKPDQGEWNRAWGILQQPALGSIILQGDFLVSIAHGRKKKKKVALHDTALIFLRSKDSKPFGTLCIAIEKLLIITYRPPGFLPPMLTVYWASELENSERVSGAEICFKGMRTLKLWAKFLAMACQRNRQSDSH